MYWRCCGGRTTTAGCRWNGKANGIRPPDRCPAPSRKAATISSGQTSRDRLFTMQSELPTLPFDQAHPLLPEPLVRELRERGPIHRVRTLTGDEAWLVTGYEEVRSLYGDSRVGRSHPAPDTAARLTASALF